MHWAAVEADDGDLVRLRLHRLEQLRRQIGPRGLQHGVTLRGEFGANDVEDLRRQLTPQIEQPMTTGFEHALEPAVARQQRALAILHRQRLHQQMPGHDTPP